MPSLLSRERTPAVVHRAAFGARITPTVARDSFNAAAYTPQNLPTIMCHMHAEAFTYQPLPAAACADLCRAHSSCVTGNAQIASSGATCLVYQACVKAAAVYVQTAEAHHWSTMLERGVLVPLQESRERMRDM